jgi:hypothetical protein
VPGWSDFSRNRREMKEKIMNRTRQITIETRSITIIRTRSGKPTNLVYCPNCETNTAVFPSAQAALIFRINSSELENLFQTNRIHFAENGDLCGNSLAAFFDKEIRYVED